MLLTGAEIVIECLKEQGVDTVFGYPGGTILNVYDELYKHSNEEKGIGYMAWSWKGNSGGVEYLDLAVEWDGSVLSEDWGEVAVNGENGIRQTSQICTVFEEAGAE